MDWALLGPPCNGFYVDLLRYQRLFYPCLTNREVGTIISKIDPWLAASVDISRPENLFRKANRISSRKRDMDDLVTYTSKQSSGKNSNTQYYCPEIAHQV